MEGELNTLIEQSNLVDKKFEIKEEEEDDFQSSLDLKEFEKKIKTQKVPNIVDKYIDNSIDSSDQEDNKWNYNAEKSIKPPVFTNIKPITKKTLSKTPAMQEPESKIEQITKEIITKSSGKGKTEEDEIEKVIATKNENIKDKKIKELSQKMKQLTVAFEKEKNLRAKLEKEMQQILKETESNLEKIEIKTKKPGISSSNEQNNKNNNTAAVISDKNDNISPEEWKSKYLSADKKIQELRFEKQTLKNDLNKANRVISKEIGDNFNIDEALLQENSWKGRAQQIQILQNKIKELQAKISVNNTVYSEQRADMNGSNYSQISNISKSADERRKEIENLKNQNISLKNENELLQSKIKAVNSRKTILENEMKDIKSQYDENKKLLVEKSGNDDKYIMALKNEIEKLKSQVSSLSSSLKTKEITSFDKPKIEMPKFPNDNEKLKQEYLLLRDQMEQKEKIIKELINEKVKDSSFRNDGEVPKVKELETELMILKKENEEMVKTVTANYDKDSEFTIKSLCTQNAQLRKKLYDIQLKLDNKMKK